MSELNERIEVLEKTINELNLDVEASKMAITVLSAVINKMSGDTGILTNSYEQEKSSAPLVKFNHPGQEDYEEQLTRRVLALLSQKS